MQRPIVSSLTLAMALALTLALGMGFMAVAARGGEPDGPRVRPQKTDAAQGPRIYLCTDLEGVAGVLDSENWCLPTGMFFQEGRELLMGEINAAVSGFFDGGAFEVTVLSGHGHEAIIPEKLDERATLQRWYYPEIWPLRIDRGYDAFALVGQHAKAGTPGGHLSHTGSMHVIDQRINGLSLGEYGQGALCAKESGVPTIFAAGDEALCVEAETLTPGVVTVAVKFGLSPDDGCRTLTSEQYHVAKVAVVTLAPAAARKRIYAGAKEAVERLIRDPDSFTYADSLTPPYRKEVEIRPAEPGGEPTIITREHPTRFSAVLGM